MHIDTGDDYLMSPSAPTPGLSAEDLAKLIAACDFKFVSDSITVANYRPTAPVGAVKDMRRVSYHDLGDKFLTTAQTVAAMDRLGYRPATLAELLIWARSEKRWNRLHWVVALGSCMALPKGSFAYPCVNDGDSEDMYPPEASLTSYDNHPDSSWYYAEYFLMVRK